MFPAAALFQSKFHSATGIRKTASGSREIFITIHSPVVEIKTGSLADIIPKLAINSGPPLEYHNIVHRWFFLRVLRISGCLYAPQTMVQLELT